MKYKPFIVSIGLIGFMSICSYFLSGPATSNTSNCLNAKHEYALMSVVQKETVIQSEIVSARNSITFPNAKHENVSTAEKDVAGVLN